MSTFRGTSHFVVSTMRRSWLCTPGLDLTSPRSGTSVVTPYCGGRAHEGPRLFDEEVAFGDTFLHSGDMLSNSVAPCLNPGRRKRRDARTQCKSDADATMRTICARCFDMG